MQTAVHCKQVTKTFGAGEDAVKVLRGIDLEVPAGEMSFLVGPSGCGKTTLLSVIAGLLNPSTGNLHVLGQPLHQMKSRDAVEFRRTNLGFVFQQFNLLPALTAAENAAVPLLAARVPAARPSPAPRNCSPNSASRNASTLTPTSSPAASNNASPLPAPSSMTRA
jgi:putative ABC transport system ATP-binding protein